ncbi:MAG: tannase and feruloyl esterase, partial [Enterovirga sp.]|nr:tannase and feruloyl esterase [Enterovirga sp.]
GIPMGSEAHWPRWLTGAGNASALMPLFGQDFIRYMAFQPSAGPGASIADYDVERDPPRLAAMAPVYNAATFDPASGTANPAADLSAFARAGGKILLYHGWADSLVTPEMTVAFYDALAKKAGGAAQLQETARLFMVPGMDHCGISTEGPAYRTRESIR